MLLERLRDSLMDLPNAHPSGDGRNVAVQCPFCGDSRTDQNPHSLSIKVDVEPGEPIWYQCFRASCGAKGAITVNTLQELGITDLDAAMEVSDHNKTVKGNVDKPFAVRAKRNFVLVNLPTGNNIAKLAYINNRLGAKLNPQQLKDLKIQFSILDMLRINDIKQIAVSKKAIQNIDVYCVGFVSMFNDYMICRDITPDMKTGWRYYTYRISGKPDPNDLKIYCIPAAIDLMDPRSAVINVAEGAFSILGAYLNTDLGRERPNSIWAANCGSQYLNTIMRICKQYGLLKVRLNIWSDSEVELDFYKKLHRSLKNRLDIRKMAVYYNDASDDFGHPANEIKIREVSIV